MGATAHCAQGIRCYHRARPAPLLPSTSAASAIVGRSRFRLIHHTTRGGSIRLMHRRLRFSRYCHYRRTYESGAELQTATLYCPMPRQRPVEPARSGSRVLPQARGPQRRPQCDQARVPPIGESDRRSPYFSQAAVRQRIAAHLASKGPQGPERSDCEDRDRCSCRKA